MKDFMSAAIATVPCPWCGSNYPGIHPSDCFLIIAEHRALGIGKHSGYLAAFTKVLPVLQRSIRAHFHVEDDCWYSCPADPDYCGDKPRVCNCGADEWNAEINALIKEMGNLPTVALMETPPQESFQDAVRADPDMTPEQKSKWLKA